MNYSTDVSNSSGAILLDGISTGLNKSYVKDKLKLTNLGIGSALIGIEEYKEVIPEVIPEAEPESKNDGLEWYWWVLIGLAIVLVILLVFYWYRKRKFTTSYMNSFII